MLSSFRQSLKLCSLLTSIIDYIRAGCSKDFNPSISRYYIAPSGQREGGPIKIRGTIQDRRDYSFS